MQSFLVVPCRQAGLLSESDKFLKLRCQSLLRKVMYVVMGEESVHIGIGDWSISNEGKK